MDHDEIALQAPRGGRAGEGTAQGTRAETDPAILARFEADAAGVRGRAAGVCRPRTEADLASIFARAARTRTPVTPQAERTSLTGACVPEGGWVIDLSHLGPGLDEVRIDRAAGTVRCGSRVILGELQALLEADGLLYPPDPTSRHEAALGATLACNASGARTYRYGPTRDWVEGLRVVLPNGLVCDVRRGQCTTLPGGQFRLWPPGATDPIRVPAPPPLPAGVKSSIGYGARPGQVPDLLDLFIGSEGTLGVITEADLRVVPLPAAVVSILAFLPTVEAGIRLVEAARDPDSGVTPRCLEWFDATSLALARERFARVRVPGGAAVALFVEQESAAGEAGTLLERWWGLLQACGVCEGEDGAQVAEDGRGQEAFRAFRHAVPAAINERLAAAGRRKLGTDFAWPRARLREMFSLYDRVLDDIPSALSPEERTGLERDFGRVPRRLDRAAFGHVGDNHLHVNLLPQDDAEEAAGRLAYRALARATVAAGGSVAGEHGIGKTKRELLAWMVGPGALARMRDIKRALDPAWVLAPGNLFEPPGAADAPAMGV